MYVSIFLVISILHIVLSKLCLDFSLGPFSSPIRVTCPAALIVPNLIIPIIPEDEHKSWSFSLHNFLHLPTIWSLLGPNIPFKTIFSNTLTLRSLLNVTVEACCTKTELHSKLYVCIFYKIFTLFLNYSQMHPRQHWTQFLRVSVLISFEPDDSILWILML
jgi:hypothetical protein